MEVILIAGVARNGVIGVKGKLPWHYSSDLKRFKQLTVGHAVIMGLGTYKSLVGYLGHALPDRLNIVLSKDKNEKLIGAEVAGDLEEAISIAAGKGHEKIFIIGGQTVFEQYLAKNYVDKLELTIIDKDYEGDAFFPKVDFSKWKFEKKENVVENGTTLSFVSYSLIGASSTVYVKKEDAPANKMENQERAKRGLFIVFDGIDGCGKSTQMKKLSEYLFASNKHNHVILTREPYKDRKIRGLLKADSDPKSQAQLIGNLFIEDRIEHANELINPSLDNGMIVVSDRYKLSTIAYQSAQGLDMQSLIERHKGLPIPDITFIIDVPAKISAERMLLEARDRHKFEANLDFMEKVRQSFLEAKEILTNENICVINGDQTKEQIFEEVKMALGDYFSGKLMVQWKIDDDDLEIAEAIKMEEERQEKTINLIPSENYASKNVINACANVLINKYAEGYPNKRYYQGNKNADSVESLAIERAKKLFGAEHVNVQPYSGSPANLAVYLAFLKPGEKVMGLDLTCGGHLTHGSPVNLTGMFFNAVHYGVNEQGFIDMEKVREIALREKPKMIISGLTAYPRKIDFAAFQKIAEEVGAIHLADISHISGLIVAGVHPSPFPHADIVMTTTHKTLRGPRGAILMCKEKYAKQIDKAVFPGCQGGPHENIIAAKAVAFREAMTPEFKAYGKQIVKNAKVLAETLMLNGIKLVSNGTDNHLILIDLRDFGIGIGKDVAIALEEAGIVANANTIPYDPSTPFKPSGLRLGTPMVTTRGFKESEMIKLGEWMSAVIKDRDNAELKAKIKKEVEELCDMFPVYRK